ncbi:MAG TPA: hypothetical protein LFW21_04625 [Rickettsia endosymbiont of Pyrocoelia pectoralis]|nr:hypothetical protein [Rickettsia endosymbiont of Pyrocoelia pectoralis]
MATTDNSKYTKTLEKILSYNSVNKVFDSAIKDLSSSKSLGLRTILLGAKFVLTHPVNTYNLFKLAKSSDIYLDPEFQKSLLEKSTIWDFLKNHSDDLPKIGQILAKAGFREFQENNFLDQKGLERLKGSFKNKDVLEKLQAVAVEIKKEVPDWTKVTSQTLDMLARDENFKKFFNEKREDITSYLREGAIQTLPGDYLKTFDDILQNSEKKNSYLKVVKIFDQNPNLKQQLAENINNYSAITEFNKLNSEKQAYIKDFLAEAKGQAKPALKEYFENYKIDPKVLDTVPAWLNKIPEVKEIFDTLNNPNQGVMVALEKTLEMVNKDEKLRNFFADNKEFLPNMASGIIENTPDLQKISKDYNLDKQILKIAGEVMSKPKIAHDIISDVNKGDYMSLTSNLISALNDPSFKLKDMIVEQSRDGLFDNLIKGILDQDQKDSKIITAQLENYGLKSEDFTKLTSVMPLLLDKPESLQKVFSGFIKGNYTAMAKELIKLTEEKPEIKQYLNDNKEIFAGILDKTLKEVPGVGNLEKEKLYSILPSMLNHPKELVKIIEGVENSSYKTAAAGLYNLAQKTSYFEGQLPSLVKAGVEVGLNYVAQKVTGMFSNASVEQNDKVVDYNILIEEAVNKVFLQAQSEGKQNLPNKKEFTQQIKTLCIENPELKDYITEKLSSNPINSVSDVSTPKANQYKHATDHANSPMQVLNPLYENLVNNQDIKSNLVANIINEKVMHKLFGNGDNRGEDFYMTGKMLKQVMSDYSKENPNKIDSFLEPQNQKILVNDIEDTLKPKSKYTLAGLATGGIYLPKEIFNDELKESLKNKLENSFKSNIVSQAKNIVKNINNEIFISNNSSNSYLSTSNLSKKNKPKVQR